MCSFVYLATASMASGLCSKRSHCKQLAVRSEQSRGGCDDASPRLLQARSEIRLTISGGGRNSGMVQRQLHDISFGSSTQLTNLSYLAIFSCLCSLCATTNSDDDAEDSFMDSCAFFLSIESFGSI
jgi:hypothetical protein